jgi:hypothetical protein
MFLQEMTIVIILVMMLAYKVMRVVHVDDDGDSYGDAGI